MRPGFAQIEKLVQSYFKTIPGHGPGQILSRDQVKPLLPLLAQAGWTVPERAKLLERILSKDSFLVRQLRTKRGRPFSADVARLPRGFDRLDRLSQLPNGKKTIRDLLKNPGGAKMIEYMTTTRGGKQMGRMLAKDPKGVDFNRPTVRIYTEKDLLAALKRLYRPQTSSP